MPGEKLQTYSAIFLDKKISAARARRNSLFYQDFFVNTHKEIYTLTGIYEIIPTMNTEYMKAIFDYVNAELFSDELPTPHFHVMSDDDMTMLWHHEIDGICIPEGNTYFIGIAHNVGDKNAWFNTMVHEMIHIWQMENGKHINHSGWFIVWCRNAIETFYGEFEDVSINLAI